MTDNRHPLVLTDWIAIFAVPFVIVLIFILYLLQPYPVAQKEYPQNHLERIPNPLYKNESMILIIYMNAETFSAHEPINISVELYHDSSHNYFDDPEYRGIDRSKVIYRIAFENTYGSSCPGVIAGCYFDLKPGEGGIYRSGWHQITYSVGGLHDIFLFNQTTSTEEFRAGIKTSQVGKPFIQIESIAAMNSLQQAEAAFNAGKLVVTVAIIAALAGSLTLYHRIRGSWISILEERKTQKQRESAGEDDRTEDFD